MSIRNLRAHRSFLVSMLGLVLLVSSVSVACGDDSLTGDAGNNLPIPPPREMLVTLTIDGGPGGEAYSDCGSNCIGEPGWITTVEAQAYENYEFAGWACERGLCPIGNLASNPTTLTINKDTLIRPSFRAVPTPSPITPMVTLNLIVRGGGYVNSLLGEGPCVGPQTCTYTTIPGTILEIDADPDPEYNFDRWDREKGDGFSFEGSSDSIISLTLDQDTELEVLFELKKPVDLLLDVTDGGYVDRLLGMLCDGPDRCRYTASEKTSVELRAVPDSGYKFECWSSNDSCFSFQETTSHIFNTSTSYEVRFIPVDGP